MAEMSAADDIERFLEKFSRLPEFPSRPMDESGETLASAYQWAAYLIEGYGVDASYHALSGVLKGIEAGDYPATRGWRNILDVIGDLSRGPSPGESVH